MLAALDIDLVFDVGANTGQYARRLRDAGYRRRIVSFEPLRAPFRELRRCAAPDVLWDVRRLALASTEGAATMNVAIDDRDSSLLEVGRRHLERCPESAVATRETVQTTMLDLLWPEIVAGSARVHLKADVQGAELDVLQGAQASLGRVESIELELSLVPLYEGGALFGEVVEYVHARGFRLAIAESVLDCDISGEMLQLDGLFVRADADLLRRPGVATAARRTPARP